METKMEWIFRQIAEKENTTVEAVRMEIFDAMEDAQKRCDTATLALWDAIARKGDRLTPEELIEYIIANTSP